MPSPKPVVLCILDGWGLRGETEANAVALANTPNFDNILASYPNATLVAHGPDVGLPEGQIGNSEVGHMNIGAGRVVWMDLPKINNDIDDNSFDINPALQMFIEKTKKSGGVAHLAGLVSTGGVHSHQDHIVRAAKVIAAAGVPVFVHAILDGRDVAPKSALDNLTKFKSDLPESVNIATVCGRFFAMDRDNRWERVQQAYDLIMNATGKRSTDAFSAVNEAYDLGETDEFVSPYVIGGYNGVNDGDGLLFMNFRADRAREILSALAAPEFKEFDVGVRPKFTAICGLVEYSDDHTEFMDTMYPSEEIKNTLGHWVSEQGKKQYRLAETEKYPHVTFFMNGGAETPDAGEDRYVAPSPKVKTYDLQPEMSSLEVTNHLIEAIEGQEYDLIIVNYANPDMVGHTGDLQAAISACEAVDTGLGRALEALNKVNGSMIVTADHGNCEMMIDPETGGPHTAHTTNPVPVILVGGPGNAKLRSGGRLADLAPTLLQLMKLDQPQDMTGKSLIV